MLDYEEFLASKRISAAPAGFEVTPEALNAKLFDWQRQIVRWALRRGRAAAFLDCGLGKTPIQLEWARQVHQHTGRDVLILAPLAVARQTAREGEKFGIHVTVCRSQDDVRPGVNVTNYDMLQHFDPDAFGGLVLDESSILKGFGGSVRKEITAFGQHQHYRLACTATPAPNDLIELTNHAEFLDVMSGKEIIALFFTQDGNTTHKWRLKGHAKSDFWRWLSSWSVAARRPSDLGYPDGGFVLPDLHIEQITVYGGFTGKPGAQRALFPLEASGLDEVRAAARESLPERVQMCADLVNTSPGPWLVWCNLNAESEALAKAIPGAVEVKGSDSPAHKEAAVMGFLDGSVRVLVSKPSICGFGMNFQHCHQTAFVGLSYSYEQFYQAVRRCWRFGQTQPVACYVITSESDGPVKRAIQAKEKQAETMMAEIVGHMAALQLDGGEQQQRDEMVYRSDRTTGKGWTMLLGDAIERIDDVATESVGLSVFSPPFPGMYAYTNSARDIGNARDVDEMIEHFRHLVTRDKLWRVLKPGRQVCVHLCQLTAMLSRDGYIGIKDYRGRVIQLFQEEGWIYTGEVTIDKNPQIQATRNKDRGLLFKSLATDSSVMRMALADYLLYFKKPGENAEPIKAGISQKYNKDGGWITEEEWVEWAAPVWYRQTKAYPGGIRETDVLNVRQAKETDDERHLCPLQLGVIERAVKLWSNPGDLVLSPFAGIGSEGVESLKWGRQFIGIELKESYYQTAIQNLRRAATPTGQTDFLAIAAAPTAPVRPAAPLAMELGV